MSGWFAPVITRTISFALTPAAAVCCGIEPSKTTGQQVEERRYAYYLRDIRHD